MVRTPEGAFPVPEDETERLADLYDYEILDTAPDPTYDDLTRLAAKVCERPMAAITFIDEHRQWVKAEVGGGAQTSHRSESFCARAITDPTDVYVVEDATNHPEFQDNPYVLEKPELRFYAGAPIRSYRGHGLGTICVLDTETGTLDDEEREALAALSRTVTLQLELRRRSKQLQRANEDVERIASALGEDGREALNVVETSLQALASHSEDLGEDVLDRLRDAKDEVRQLDRMIAGLEEYTNVAGQRDPMTSFALREALDDAEENLEVKLREKDARIEGHGLPVVWADRQQITILLRKVLGHLLDAASPGPTIHVTAHRGDDVWRIVLNLETDDLDAKRLRWLAGTLDPEGQEHGGDDGGLGLALCRRIVDRHGGEIAVEAGNGEDALISFTLPGPAEGTQPGAA